MPEQTTMHSCCLSGTLASGTPKGTERNIAGLPTYIAQTSTSTLAKTIIFLPDGMPSSKHVNTFLQQLTSPLLAFGWTLPNIRLLADQYAEAGFTAYVPDVHHGDSLPASLLTSVEPTVPAREQMSYLAKALGTLRAGANLGPWLIRHREAVSRPVIEAFITEVRFIPGVEKVGVVGFCWGGRYAILTAQEPFSGAAGKGVDAAYVAHPSLCAIPGDFAAVCVPLSIALGEKDSYLGPSEVRQIEDVMAKKRGGDQGRQCKGEVLVYKDQVHGFALRGDQENEEDRKALDRAAQQGIEWFKGHLS